MVEVSSNKANEFEAIYSVGQRLTARLAEIAWAKACGESVLFVFFGFFFFAFCSLYSFILQVLRSTPVQHPETIGNSPWPNEMKWNECPLEISKLSAAEDGIFFTGRWGPLQRKSLHVSIQAQLLHCGRSLKQWGSGLVHLRRASFPWWKVGSSVVEDGVLRDRKAYTSALRHKRCIMVGIWGNKARGLVN